MRPLQQNASWLLPLVVLSLAVVVPAADVAPGAKKENSLIDPPEVALRKFSVAPGLKVDLFAAEPDVRNPVAMSIDKLGRVYVVESDRRRSSVFDIRGHKEWLEADLSFRTVQERANFLQQQVSPTNPAVIKRLTAGGRGTFEDFNRDGVIDWRDIEVQSERIRLLEDTNGDGRADRVSVFADGFTNIVAGVAAGVLAHGDDVYFACIPDLWRIRSFELSAQAATRNTKHETRNLLTGFGVHIAFGGHDMHGLIMGPDGKLYWSIADRGTDTNRFSTFNPIPGLTPELLADSGCIFRANPDGSELEVMAWGLRNPQELAFDEYGNLFTADNNGDGGDKARWHYVVEGADFGWRIGWQWLEARAYQPRMGPWNGERLWHLAESNTAAWLLPPLAHIGHGPAGLAYNPGTGLPPQFDRHFFLCDFPGHVLMWTNIPDGASFKAGPVKNFFGDLGPTDVAFHPDGGVLVSDWFKTFDKTDKGRLYRIHDPATDASGAVRETKRLLSEGMAKRSVKELAELLGHADMRVRLEAQWELASRQEIASFRKLAIGSKNRLVRLHALWGIGQIVRPTPNSSYVEELLSLAGLLNDPDDKVRSRTARLLGEMRLLNAGDQLRNLILDPSPEVRFHAVMANRDLNGGFSRGFGFREKRTAMKKAEDFANVILQRPTSGQSLRWPTLELYKILDDDRSSDGYLPHAGASLLADMLGMNLRPGAYWHGVIHANFFLNVVSKSPRTRMALLQAYRRHGYVGITNFLSDPDPKIVFEAARAINDVPIEAAFPELAALLPVAQSEIRDPKSETTFFTLRRALNANFRLGQAATAQALAAFAARDDAPEALRIEALELLGDWPKPPARDHIMGLYRPLPSRDGKPAADALRPVLASLLHDAPKDVRLAAMRAAGALAVKESDFFALATDVNQSVEVRVEALKSLAAQKDSRLAEALNLALNDKSETLRIEAGRLKGGSGNAVEQWAALLERGTIAEKQGVLASVAAARPADSDTQLRSQLDNLMSKPLQALLSGELPKELQLDVIEAAKGLKSWNLAGKVAQFESSFSKDDPLAAYRPALYGGNAQNGRKLFIENQQIACFRCHKVNGEGGEVGPELTGIGLKKGREYILESIIYPNKQIAADYENLMVTLKNGTIYAGQVKQATDKELLLNSPEDGLVKVATADIKERQRGLSAMPEELVTYLSRRELRDLIEFLATLK